MRVRTLMCQLVLITAVAADAHAADVLTPNANLKADGLPPIPAELAARVAPYTEFKPATAVSWHPQKRELIVARRAGNTTQLHRVAAPGGELVQLTDYVEPVRDGVFWPKAPNVLVFTRDAGGNEQQQIYRLDAAASEPVLLTDAARKNELAGITHARDRLLVESTDLDKTGRREDPTVDLSLVDPLDPAKRRKLATLPGTGWGDITFSFDDRQLALVEYKSVNESYVWLMDAASGERRRVLPATAASAPIASSDLNFSRDGKGLFLSTDRDGEFRKLAYFDLASGKLDYFGEGGNWDVESIALSPDGRVLAVITNEAGVGVLRLYDATTRKPLPRPVLPTGNVHGLVWHENSRDLAVSVNSAQSPNDAYAIDVRDNVVTRWTQTRVAGLDAASFRNAEPVEWKSFDGRAIGGFIIRPPAKFTGKRPVIVTIHGGPESQARPGFMGRWNYFIDELGVAILQPNVRGSTGYGKTFVALDNGMKREDSVKDIGALFDWIAAQPDLDASRIIVEGGSYGGYMVLAVATNYPERIAGTIDVVGVANFVSFLENTESYRRDLRRVEYGDERDPAMREFLTRISPVNNASKIKAPLFVVHGRNDPRVPYTEAEQIVTAARKNGVPVWYLLADNEGHGYARKANVDYLFYAMIEFIRMRAIG
ncbi:MAG TPA: prolyl oligopeptidase family serine peptidase [Casimicrobiaceae bacterium]|nr:prolyl oligopeptidase family serine peptidase [Casimicrobiaceae bacterium]